MNLTDLVQEIITEYFGDQTDNPDDIRLLAEHLIDSLGLREEFVVKEITKYGASQCYKRRWVTPWHQVQLAIDPRD